MVPFFFLLTHSRILNENKNFGTNNIVLQIYLNSKLDSFQTKICRKKSI